VRPCTLKIRTELTSRWAWENRWASESSSRESKINHLPLF